MTAADHANTVREAFTRVENGTIIVGRDADDCGANAALDALVAQAEAAERRADNAEFELKALDHMRVKDNGYLIERAEAAEAEVVRLRDGLREIAEEEWGLPNLKAYARSLLGGAA